MCYIRLFFAFIFPIFIVNSFKLVPHAFEPKIAYIYGLKNLNNLNKGIVYDIRHLFQRHPLLIFKKMDTMTLEEVIHFLKIFDDDYNTDIIDNLEEHKYKLLKNTKNKISNFNWEVDMLGHKYEQPNVVSGMYYFNEPNIDEMTNFVNGETIFTNLNENDQKTLINMQIEINRYKHFVKKTKTDYYGVERIEDFHPMTFGSSKIPLVYSPENYLERPSILLTPTYFERVIDWPVKDSREWIKNFMYQNVLPYRVCIQWQKGDLAVINNRRFIYANTPRKHINQNYMHVLLPTTRKLTGFNDWSKITEKINN